MYIVIIIMTTIKSPKVSMALSVIGLTFTTNALGVGISMVFKILGHFLFQGMEAPCNVMTCIPLDVPQHKKQEHVGLGVGILTVF
jgi:hypothetical protein